MLGGGGNDKASYSRPDIRKIAATRPPVGTRKNPYDFKTFMKVHGHYHPDFIKMCNDVAEEVDDRNKNKKKMRTGIKK